MAYINLPKLEALTRVKSNIKKDNKSRQEDIQSAHEDIEFLYQPIIEPIKQVLNQPALPPPTPLLSLPPPEQPPPLPELPPPQRPILSLGVLADKYLKTPSIRYDHAYGIKPVEGSIHFRIGRMDVRIQEDDLIIDGEHYRGTEGLWELLTLKDPQKYTPDDLEVYKKILVQTKAFLLDRRENEPDRVKCNRGDKYKNIIKHVANEWRVNRGECSSKKRRLDHTGEGVVFLPSSPNALVDRHRLLFGAYKSGNTGVFNELQAINDKLLQLGVFDQTLIKVFNTQFLS